MVSSVSSAGARKTLVIMHPRMATPGVADRLKALLGPVSRQTTLVWAGSDLSLKKAPPLFDRDVSERQAVLPRHCQGGFACWFPPDTTRQDNDLFTRVALPGLETAEEIFIVSPQGVAGLPAEIKVLFDRSLPMVEGKMLIGDDGKFTFHPRRNPPEGRQVLHVITDREREDSHIFQEHIKRICQRYAGYSFGGITFAQDAGTLSEEEWWGKISTIPATDNTTSPDKLRVLLALGSPRAERSHTTSLAIAFLAGLSQETSPRKLDLTVYAPYPRTSRAPVSRLFSRKGIPVARWLTNKRSLAPHNGVRVKGKQQERIGEGPFLNTVYPSLRGAEVIIFAAPVYIGAYPAPFTAFIDYLSYLESCGSIPKEHKSQNFFLLSTAGFPNRDEFEILEQYAQNFRHYFPHWMLSASLYQPGAEVSKLLPFSSVNGLGPAYRAGVAFGREEHLDIRRAEEEMGRLPLPESLFHLFTPWLFTAPGHRFLRTIGWTATCSNY